MGTPTWAPAPPAVSITPPGVHAPQWDTGLLTHALRREDIGSR
ncbi:hypothetical protein ACIOKD_02895 [Streptomyces sp. NPDC087844]